MSEMLRSGAGRSAFGWPKPRASHALPVHADWPSARASLRLLTFSLLVGVVCLPTSCASGDPSEQDADPTASDTGSSTGDVPVDSSDGEIADDGGGPGDVATSDGAPADSLSADTLVTDGIADGRLDGDSVDSTLEDSVADRDLGDVGPERTPKVLIIGIDGTRPDALAIANTPHLDALATAGAFSGEAHTGDITYSGPGWSSILTGVWRDKHGVDDNSFGGSRFLDYPALFARLESLDAEMATASVVDWPEINEQIVKGADRESTFDLDAVGDVNVVASAVDLLGDEAFDVDLLFVYFGDIDEVGHAHGFHPTVPEYIAEIEEVDGQLGLVLDALHGRARYAEEDWLILVVTDHGGTKDGTHGDNIPEHRTTFFLASGPQVQPGSLDLPPSVVDVVPTALAHLGVDVAVLARGWGLDGHIRGIVAPPAPESAFGVNLLRNGDAEWDRGFAEATPDGLATGWRDPGAMTVIAYDSEGYPSASSPGPEDRRQNLFVGGLGASSTMEQRVDLRSLADEIDGGGVTYELSAYLGGYEAQDDAATLTVTFFPAGARDVRHREAFFFREAGSGDAEVIAYDVDIDTGRAGYPIDIGESPFAGLWSDGPDAAVNWGDGTAYFFRGGEVIGYDIAAAQVLPGYPEAITAESWPGLWSEGPEAGLNWGNGKVYFFRGGEYVRFDIDDHATDADYPRAIDATTWPGLQVFDGIDAVLTWPNGKAYFFRGDQYARYDIAGDAVDAGYPRDIGIATWPGVWDDRVDAALLWDDPVDLALGSGSIGPVTAADRGDVTGLLARSTSGSVPVGSRSALVRLSVTRAAGQVADGYADDLSLVLRE